MEWPIPKRLLKRRQREALFVIERVFWEEKFSEFVYDEEREVFLMGRAGLCSAVTMLFGDCWRNDPYRSHGGRRSCSDGATIARCGHGAPREGRPRSTTGSPQEGTQRPW
jgi:hypothetical protein